MRHKILERQILRATGKDGALNLEALLNVISLMYNDYDRSLLLQNHATQLMSDELNELNEMLRTERDDRVAELQKRFELAVEGTNDGIWDWNTLEDKIWFSTRAKLMLGYDPAQLTGSGINHWYDLVDLQDIERAKSFIFEHLSAETTQVLTLKFKHATGGVRHIMCRASAVRNAVGRVVRLVGVHTDITSFVLMNAELKRTKEAADAANVAKSDFLANMSHELRTPLNSIIGMTRMLLEMGMEQEQAQMADTVFKSSVNLLDIVNDILDLSKIEAGEMMMENIGFDVTYVFDSAVEALKRIAEEKHLALRIIYDKESFPYVMGDPLRLTRIVTNLVSNAIKYTDRGHVEFRAFCKKREDGCVDLRCEVQDTGIGISPRKRASIFEKFVQADTSTTRKYGGTGLGLAITKELVELMGGDIGVDSVVNEGSTFWFNLTFDVSETLTERKAMRKEIGDEGSIPCAKARILIAEDHPLNQMFVTKVMERFGIGHFKIAQNGKEVVELYENAHWDVVLMDCHMPEKNGYDATRAIRAMEKDTGIHVPIVAMTANAMVGEREKCLRYGMDDYISKPVNVEELKNILKQWLRFGVPAVDARNGSTGAGDSAAPVDMTLLESFTGEDVAEKECFIRIFVGQSDINVRVLEENRDGQDGEAWEEAAHMFKGGAAGIGARRLSTLCNKAQHFAGTPEERNQLFMHIQDEYGHIKSYFEEIGLWKELADGDA